MKNAVIILLALAVAIMWVVGSLKGVQHHDAEKVWQHKVEEVLAQHDVDQRTIDSLQSVIHTQQAFRARIDSLDIEIVRDPRYQVGAYRDSTVMVKLQFILGHR